MEIEGGNADVVTVTFTVADRMNYTDVKCRVSGKFTRAAVLLLQGKIEGAGIVSIGVDWSAPRFTGHVG